MLKNYIKIAFRNLRKQKLYSLINIFGLTLGIACCLIIYLFIQDEYSFDRFHENSENVYRIEEVDYDKRKSEIGSTSFFDTRSPEGISKSIWLPLPMGPAIGDMFPEIEETIRMDESNFVVTAETGSFEQDIFLTDPAFFRVFSFQLIQGDPQTVLEDPSNIVLTPEAAEKYFGNDDPIGKPLEVAIRGEEKTFTVSGIVKSPPSNSSIEFSMITHIQNRPGYDVNMEHWNRHNTPLFVMLAPGANRTEFLKKLNDFGAERYADSWKTKRERMGWPEDATVMEYSMSSLADIHLDASAYVPKGSNALYSYILGAIAILILIIACINYITLALARSSGRAKEVGIRKTSGAHRSQIALQFWGETQLIAFLSMVVGVGLVELVLPFFNSLADKSLAINYLADFGILGVLFVITLVTGLIAGSYPAMILSGYQPVKVLKGISSFKFKPRLTKILLVAQYSLSIFLIISSIIMFKQMDYVAGKDLGYNEEHAVFISTFTGWNEEGTNLMMRFRDELNDVPEVESVSGMAPAFTTGSNHYGFRIDGEEKGSYIYFVDHELVQTLDFEITAGRSFSVDRPTDIKNAIIVNEALVESMDWENPIGKLYPWKGEENPSTVIGVVKNFHFQSLETEIEPMLFHMDPDHGGVAEIAVKIEQGAIAEVLPKLEEIFTKVAPATPFNYWFLDDAVAGQYEQYNRWLNIMGTSTLMAILIACLGLFGLAGLTAVNKTKEVGIRKVLGAGMSQIILLLNKDVVKLIALSIFIAAPVSWYVMDLWLSDFAFRIEMNAGLFAMAGFITLLISLATVSYYSVKTALLNPVESLRSE